MRVNRSHLAGALCLLAASLTPLAAAAQSRPAAEPSTALYAYTLRHQPASEALDLVRPMLSARGMVKLQAGARTLEVRDEPPVIAKVAAFLHSYDHPPLMLDLDVMVVRASRPTVSPPLPDPPEIPAELLSRWRNLLPYRNFHLVARAALEPLEGEEVAYEMGAGYRVSFRLGTLLANRRIKLLGFRLVKGRRGAEQELIHTTLSPELDQSTSLGLAQDEASPTALMVVVICRNPRRPGPTAVSGEGEGGS